MSELKHNIEISIPNISGNEREYLNSCIDEGFVSSVGRFVNSFEKGLINQTEIKYCSVVSSGTNALIAALISAGVSKDDLVIIPDYTFIATANAVHFSGASPWLFDIDLNTLNLDIEYVSTIIRKTCKYVNSSWIHTSTNKKVSAIVPVFAIGNYMNFDELNSFYNEFGIPIIIDAAGALATKNVYKDFKVLDYASIIFSFNGNKIITSGGGGAILTNNEELASSQKDLTTTARISNTYHHKSHSFNFRMTNLQAAVGIAQLERLSEFLQIKSNIFNHYVKELSKTKDIYFHEIPSNHWLSYFIFKKNISKKLIKRFYIRLNESGIMLREFWIPISEQRPYLNAISSLNGNTNTIYNRIITLPSSTSITEQDIYRICDEVKSFLD